MELLFLLAFVAFIVLNIVVGVIASARKRRLRAGVGRTVGAKTETRPAGESRPLRQERPRSTIDLSGMLDRASSSVSFLQEQTAGNLFAAPVETSQAEGEAGDDGDDEEKRPRPTDTRDEPRRRGAAAGEPRRGPDVRPARSRAQRPLSPASERAGGAVEQLPQPSARESVTESRAWQRIQELPTFQRAVVLSEILGRPKSLDLDVD
jgi:hypothetical protein